MGQINDPIFSRGCTMRFYKLKRYRIRQVYLYPHLKSTTTTRRRLKKVHNMTLGSRFKLPKEL